MASLDFTVIRCSSEAKGCEAKSVNSAIDRKWQCDTLGSHEFIIVQLERPSNIGKLVVQNNNAAIFSVEACDRPAAQEKSKWQVLLGTSSLMKPSEAREGTNGTNSFTFTKFKDDAKDGLWSCLKFNVFQPFNKNLPCGLSSIRVYSNIHGSANTSYARGRASSPVSIEQDDHKDPAAQLHSVRAHGGIKSLIASGKPSNAPSRVPADTEDAEDDDDIIHLTSNDQKSSAHARAPVKMSLLSKSTSNRLNGAATAKATASRGRSRDVDSDENEERSQSSRGSRKRVRPTKAAEEVDGETSPVTIKRQTRASSRQSSVSSVQSNKSTSRKKAVKKAPVVEEEAEEVAADDPDEGSVKKRRPDSPVRGGQSARSRNTKAGSSSATASSRGAPRVSPLRDDDVEDSRPRRGLRNEKPFAKIMDDVVFSLSGFVNPERGQLRSDALQMGARYKPDWTDDCNYLICAFPDTPKYDEAVACSAHIVKKDWINECCQQRKLLPWRQYRLYGYENAVDDDGVDDAVIPDSAAEVQADRKTVDHRKKSQTNNRRGLTSAAAGTSSSSRGRRGRGAASISTSNRRSRDGAADDEDEDADQDDSFDKDAVLALLTGDDEDEDKDYVPGDDEADAAEEEEEDAETALNVHDFAKEEAEADAEIEPEDDDFIDDDEV